MGIDLVASSTDPNQRETSSKFQVTPIRPAALSVRETLLVPFQICRPVPLVKSNARSTNLLDDSVCARVRQNHAAMIENIDRQVVRSFLIHCSLLFNPERNCPHVFTEPFSA